VAGKPEALAAGAEVAVDEAVVEEICKLLVTVHCSFFVHSLPDLLTVLPVTVDRNAAAYVF
jgi:hypothetical protein